MVRKAAHSSFMRQTEPSDHPRAEAFMKRQIPSATSGNEPSRSRTKPVVTILVVIALLHLLRVGTYLHDPLFALYYSYFSDMIVPLGMYLLLCLKDDQVPLLGDWRVKALVVFGVASSAEAMQAFGVPLLGRTFDPLDFVMFAVGVALAVVLDRVLLPGLLPRWSPRTVGPPDAIPSRTL